MPARPVDRGVRRQVDGTGGLTAEASTGDMVVANVADPGMMSFCPTGAQDAYVGLPSNAQPLDRTRISRAVRKDLGLKALRGRWLEGR